MREIDCSIITSEVSKLLITSCYKLDAATEKCLKDHYQAEKNLRAKTIMSQLLENLKIAEQTNTPICQDTGIAVIFIYLGQEVHINGDLESAIINGVKIAYEKGYLRKSVVRHPLDRVNTNDNTMPIIHYQIIPGDKVIIKVAPKGAGSENMSAIAMLSPIEGIEGVKKFVIDTVQKAKGKPCPPIIVGVGIGGTFEKCALLAKEALLRPINDQNNNELDQKLETDLYQAINNLNIGPMGLGGNTSCLAVKVNSYPCHIASLPVAVNIQCHVSRHQEVTL